MELTWWEHGRFAELFRGTGKKEFTFVKRVRFEGLVRILRSALHNSRKSRGIDTFSCLASKKRRTDPRRQITRGRMGEAGPQVLRTSLSFQVRCARCRALAHSSDTIYVSSCGARTRHDEFICHTGIGRPWGQGLLMELGQVFGVCRG